MDIRLEKSWEKKKRGSGGRVISCWGGGGGGGGSVGKGGGRAIKLVVKLWRGKTDLHKRHELKEPQTKLGG